MLMIKFLDSLMNLCARNFLDYETGNQDEHDREVNFFIRIQIQQGSEAHLSLSPNIQKSSNSEKI